MEKSFATPEIVVLPPVRPQPALRTATQGNEMELREFHGY